MRHTTSNPTVARGAQSARTYVCPAVEKARSNRKETSVDLRDVLMCSEIARRAEPQHDTKKVSYPFPKHTVFDHCAPFSASRGSPFPPSPPRVAEGPDDSKGHQTRRNRNQGSSPHAAPPNSSGGNVILGKWHNVREERRVPRVYAQEGILDRKSTRLNSSHWE